MKKLAVALMSATVDAWRRLSAAGGAGADGDNKALTVDMATQFAYAMHQTHSLARAA